MNESVWQVDGEKYFSALLQSSSEPGTFYLALWWLPEFIYGHQPLSLYDINSRYDNMFQLLSPYIEKGYVDRRLVNVRVPFSSVGSATLIPLDGTASRSVEVGYDPIVQAPNLSSIAIGEMPVLIKLTGASLNTGN